MVGRRGVSRRTARRTSRRMNRRAQRRTASAAEPAADESREVDEPQTPSTPQGDFDDRYARLEKLGELHEKGILTDEEFAAEKEKLLGG